MESDLLGPHLDGGQRCVREASSDVGQWGGVKQSEGCSSGGTIHPLSVYGWWDVLLVPPLCAPLGTTQEKVEPSFQELKVVCSRLASSSPALMLGSQRVGTARHCLFSSSNSFAWQSPQLLQQSLTSLQCVVLPLVMFVMQFYRTMNLEKKKKKKKNLGEFLSQNF